MVGPRGFEPPVPTRRAPDLGRRGAAVRRVTAAVVHQRPTRRQLEVLRAYIAAGSIAAPAQELGITKTTARQHLSGLYRRTGCLNAAQAAYLLGRAELRCGRSAMPGAGTSQWSLTKARTGPGPPRAFLPAQPAAPRTGPTATRSPMTTGIRWRRWPQAAPRAHPRPVGRHRRRRQPQRPRPGHRQALPRPAPAAADDSAAEPADAHLRRAVGEAAGRLLRGAERQPEQGQGPVEPLRSDAGERRLRPRRLPPCRRTGARLRQDLAA